MPISINSTTIDNTIEEDNDIGHYITVLAFEFFSQYGIKSVSMQDIATKAGISKRTLYSLFSDKEELLMAAMDYNDSQINLIKERITQQADTVLHSVLGMHKEMIGRFRQGSNRFREDLVKYPKALHKLQKYREQNKDEWVKFFRQGISQGVFRDDVNYEILTLMFQEVIRMLIPSSWSIQFSMSQIHSTMLFAFIRGICTQKGIDIFDEYIINNTEK